MRRFATTFITGLFTLLPFLITVFVVVYLVNMINGWLGPRSYFGGLMRTLAQSMGQDVPVWFSYVLSIAIVVLFIWLVGSIARQYFGQRLGHWFEDWIIRRIPFIGKVYTSAEQVVDLLRKKDADAVSALSNVVLVRYANTHILGMLSSSEPVDINGVAHYLVYFPSTPVPATGFNYFVPCDDVMDVDVSVEEMTRIIVSLGSLGPGVMNAKSQLVLHHGGPRQPAG